MAFRYLAHYPRPTIYRDYFCWSAQGLHYDLWSYLSVKRKSEETWTLHRTEPVLIYRWVYASINYPLGTMCRVGAHPWFCGAIDYLCTNRKQQFVSAGQQYVRTSCLDTVFYLERRSSIHAFTRYSYRFNISRAKRFRNRQRIRNSSVRPEIKVTLVKNNGVTNSCWNPIAFP